MLKALTIQDLAVVRHLDVEFGPGLTILTGETGAGKSILVDALGLALGDRADSDMVRARCERASVSATFDVRHLTGVREFLQAHDLGDDDCIVRRVVGADGRSRAFCNAAPIPVALLKELGELLVDIHGQHAHQSLLRRTVQRDLLDEFADAEEAAAATEREYRQWRKAADTLAALQAGAPDIPSRIDLLQFQADELAALEVTPEALAALEAEHKRIAHAGQLTAACERADLLAFSGDDSALASARRALAELQSAAPIDPRVNAVQELIDSALINLAEAEHELSRISNDVENDPARLQQLDAKLQEVQDLARKHRCQPEELVARQTAILDELSRLTGQEDTIADLQAEMNAALERYRAAAEVLRTRREAGAARMGKEIGTRLHELGMPHARFEVLVVAGDGTPAPRGDDDIEYLVSANPDMPPKPLRKVASGGELSRVSLAIQVATTGTSGVPVLVFDEVDSGVGGPTADVVSQYLKALAEHRQILCITHLPQVASAGEQHLAIGKLVTGGTTETTIRELDAKERIEEIARMLGGRRVTAKARAHARELLTQ